ncbi:MAG: hypothetical protein SPK50_02980 [Mobiluncus porci]|uniref:Uncharacterized protein n=1 Tax=Mobiluncus porci TaxID=2652278 RepID=A0A7K0K0I3_9ACTO|nr:hypothetical protein [Mobiluncus porci]MDD7541192.1 hypothetical protein [Mobiluncus porci]MDY5748081.1 hypothetical protein [Mobiluncus porci]MST48918.1 hypothetical protein [Mobiluncus porci]
MAEQTGRKYPVIAEYSAKWKWKERAAKYDQHLLAKKRYRLAAKKLKAEEVQEALIAGAQKMAGDVILNTPIEELGDSARVRLIELAGKMATDYYRDGDGFDKVKESPQESGGSSFPDLEAMTPEERRDLLIEMKLEIERELGDG